MKILLAPILLVALLAVSLGEEKPAPAKTLFFNGNIYTVNEAAPRAEALVTEGDRILFIGSNAEAKKQAGKHARSIDLKGKTVVPGLTDSHCHIFEIGQRLTTLNLENAKSAALFLAQVKRAVNEKPHGDWVIGRGWIETFWKPSVFPTRQQLDPVSPLNPVFLERVDNHSAVVNTKALKIAGIDAKTPDPFGGKILRDPKTGEPTGMLLDNAMDLVRRKMPPPTTEEQARWLQVGTVREINFGLCQIQNAGSELPELELMQKLYAEKKIKIRIYNAVYGPGAAADAILQKGPILDAFDHHFTTRTIKVIFDGSLGSRSAALLAPYQDAPETSGFLTQKESELRPMFKAALQRGLQVETHAIGDRANREILNLYEEAFKAVPASDRKVQHPRWRIEHAQILSPTDLPRLARARIIASMQPSHAIDDFFFAPRRLGEERLKGAYAWESLLKSGVIVTGGSDAPIEEGNPMVEFYAAVARKSLQGFSAPDWHPEEAVTREQALRMFTAAPAYAAFQEKERGTLEAGKLADLTILSDDIMKIPETAIPRTRCVMTVIGGEIVYDNHELALP